MTRVHWARRKRRAMDREEIGEVTTMNRVASGWSKRGLEFR